MYGCIGIKRGRVEGSGGKAVELTNDVCSSGAVAATSSMDSPEVANDDDNDVGDDDDVDDDDVPTEDILIYYLALVFPMM